jgi:PIN domain nuclease of toxin-antitoxin system
VRLLLDTHILLWWFADTPSLSRPIRAAIADSETTAFVSVATAWEIAIKQRLGKLEAPQDVAGAVAADGFHQLLVTFDHAAVAGQLPRHHGDPFDRMLVAQAQAEGLTLVTHDPHLSQYDVPVLVAT